ncbi:hypothetical protein AX774_g3423 [Zancudomyces culisetae]|uniref:Uncharacterized protein n=1 Tax=Zancudomyces culisetae TaxID=1213189 RepID=A0A1R1PQ18_ZANCU|nr:hypothetical protein AX774_g3423 [Zancudomyces culisetae]|eukprot:OMH83085.1 hypothetical protein AX774_g3423 [Zancudomyces culisetae]
MSIQELSGLLVQWYELHKNGIKILATLGKPAENPRESLNPESTVSPTQFKDAQSPLDTAKFSKLDGIIEQMSQIMLKVHTLVKEQSKCVKSSLSSQQDPSLNSQKNETVGEKSGNEAGNETKKPQFSFLKTLNAAKAPVVSLDPENIVNVSFDFENELQLKEIIVNLLRPTGNCTLAQHDHLISLWTHLPFVFQYF